MLELFFDCLCSVILSILLFFILLLKEKTIRDMRNQSIILFVVAVAV
jgi:hypothetical protein